jgi:uncharacterized GH25 family protein
MARSKQPVVWLVLVSVLALGGLGYWFLADSPESGAKVAQGPGKATGAAPKGGEALQPQDGAGPEGGRAPTELDDVGSAAAAVGPDGQRRIQGRVMVQGGLPLDPEVRVYAFDTSLGPGEAVRLACDGFLLVDDEETSVEGRPADHDEPAPLWALYPDELRSEAALAEAEVASDGGFELVLDAGSGTVQLVAAGATQWSLEPVPWTGSRSAVLPVGVGASVYGRLVPPAGWEQLAQEQLPGSVLFLGLNERGSASVGVGSVRSRTSLAIVQPDLSYRFANVETDADLNLLAQMDGAFIEANEVIGRLEPAEVREFNTEIQIGAHLSGRVVDELGEPVPGAQVSTRFASRFGPQGRPRRESWTDGQGRFELEGVASEKVLLLVVAKGYLMLDEEVPLANPGQHIDDLVLRIESGERISGRVLLPDGTPLAGAEVTARPRMQMNTIGRIDWWRNNASEVRSGDGGEFGISGIMQGSFEVTASHEVGAGDEWAARFGWREGDMLEASVAADHGDRDIELSLKALARLSGRVLDPEGLPIEEARVALRMEGDLPMAGLGSQDDAVNVEPATGAYEFTGLQNGEWSVTVSAPGYAFMQPETLAIPTVSNRDFVLNPEIRIRGSVQTPDGLPALGAVIQLETSGMGAMLSDEEAWEPPSTRSDAAGQFELGGLPPGEASIFAAHPNFAPSLQHALTLQAGVAPEPVELVLQRGARISGVVFAPTGDVAVGEQVIAQNQSELGSRPQVLIKQTDGEGRFLFENVRPGTWQVMAFPGADRESADQASLIANMAVELVEVVDEQEVEVTLGALPEDPVKVSGRITAGGEAVTGGFVSFVLEGEKIGAMALAQIQSDGSYSTVLDKPGAVLVTVQANPDGDFVGGMTNREYREEIPDAETHVLSFDLGGGRIRGQVTDQEGQPQEGVTVKWSCGDGRGAGELGGTYAQTQTDENGRYEFPYLTEGTYDLAAGGSPFMGVLEQGGSLGRAMRPGVQVAEGQIVENIDFSLQPGHDLTGFVRDEAGESVPNATVWVFDEAGQALDQISMVRTNGSGRFTIRGLSEGRYFLQARQGTRTSPSIPTEVRAEDPAEPVLRLEQGTLLIVRVERDGEFDYDARVKVTDEAGRDQTAMLSLESITDLLSNGYQSGETRVGPVPPGRYQVVATAPDGTTASKSVQLSGKTERRLRLRLRE